MASSNRSDRPSPRKQLASSGEEEDTSAASQVMPRPSKDPLTPAPGDKGSDEVGENGVRESTPMRTGAESPPRKMQKTEANAEESPLLKQAAAAKTPPATGTNAGASKPEEEEEYDAEKHLKEKIEKYSHLWKMLLRVEEEEGLPVKEAFLKMEDAKASVLNTMVGNHYLRKNRAELELKDADNEALEYLMGLSQQL